MLVDRGWALTKRLEYVIEINTLFRSRVWGWAWGRLAKKVEWAMSFLKTKRYPNLHSLDIGC